MALQALHCTHGIGRRTIKAPSSSSCAPCDARPGHTASTRGFVTSGGSAATCCPPPRWSPAPSVVTVVVMMVAISVCCQHYRCSCARVLRIKDEKTYILQPNVDEVAEGVESILALVSTVTHASTLCIGKRKEVSIKKCHDFASTHATRKKQIRHIQIFTSWTKRARQSTTLCT